MKLEDQVCSLELAKRLKELGVKQESLFAWALPKEGEPFLIYEKHRLGLQPAYVSAFTVAELELLLPDGVNTAYKNGKPRERDHWRSMRRVHKGYEIGYRHSNYSSDSWIEQRGDTFADALAKMLIYLLENNLITA